MQGKSRRESFAALRQGTAPLLLGAALVAASLNPVHAQVMEPATGQIQVAGAARAAVAKTVQTTANLNLRSKPSTAGKKLSLILKNTRLTVTSTKSGWSQVRHAGKTGWASSTYLRAVPKAAPKAIKRGDLGKTTAELRLRKQATTGSTVLATLPKNGIYAVKKTSNGFSQIASRGKTGWVQSGYLKIVAKKPGREIYIDKKYTSNRDGLTDRYWTKVSTGQLHESVNGKIRIGDVPRNSVVYRNLKMEKSAGSVTGWIFVQTQGMSGWMKTSQLARKSTAATKPANYSAKTVLAQKNGKVAQKMLVAIGWDKEKTLIAAPALKDLNRLNAAFKKKFGRDLDVDLAYRTRETQDAYWVELGPYIAARPGTSNHGWGTAIDTPETYDYSFRGKYHKWLKANSEKYNWVHRKILEEGSPYAEAWHFDYMGK